MSMNKKIEDYYWTLMDFGMNENEINGTLKKKSLKKRRSKLMSTHVLESVCSLKNKRDTNARIKREFNNISILLSSLLFLWIYFKPFRTEILFPFHFLIFFFFIHILFSFRPLFLHLSPIENVLYLWKNDTSRCLSY